MKSFFSWATVFFVLLTISQTTVLSSPFIVLVFAGGFSVFYFLKGGRVSKLLLVIILLWLVINIWTLLIFDVQENWLLILRQVISLIIFPYVLVEIFGRKLWIKLQKLFYYLVIFTLVVYFLNIFFYAEFNALRPIFVNFTREALRGTRDYWSIGIYTKAMLSNGLYRNSGFMWEPGFYALILVFSIVFRWLNNGVKIEKHFIVYTIAIITTFSTAGYIALVLIIAGGFVKKITPINLLFISVFLIFFYYFSINQDFMSDKLNIYFTAIEEEQMIYAEHVEAIKLNRIQIFLYDIERIIKNPVGYGNYSRLGIDGTQVTGVNGLSGIMVKWGIVGILFFLFAMHKFLRLNNIANNKNRVVSFLYLSLLVMFFSNPIDSNLISYLIVFSAHSTKIGMKKLNYLNT